MLVYSRFLILLLVIQVVVVNADERSVEDEVSRPNVDIVEKLIAKNSIVGFSWVNQPLNKILLIKSGRNYCAVKYLSFSRGNDGKKSTAFKAGNESFYAEAEFYVNSEKKTKRLKLRQLQSVGLGKIILYNASKNYLYCGKEKLIWEYPTATSLLSTGGDISLSPTTLEDFNKINFEDPNLQWFHFEEGRKIKIWNAAASK